MVLMTARWLIVLCTIALATACALKQEADAKFGDQHLRQPLPSSSSTSFGMEAIPKSFKTSPLPETGMPLH